MIKNLDNLLSKAFQLMERDNSVAIKVTFPNEESLHRYEQIFLKRWLNPSWYNIYALTVIVFLDSQFGINTSAGTIGQALEEANYYGAEKAYII